MNVIINKKAVGMPAIAPPAMRERKADTDEKSELVISDRRLSATAAYLSRLETMFAIPEKSLLSPRLELIFCSKSSTVFGSSVNRSINAESSKNNRRQARVISAKNKKIRKMQRNARMNFLLTPLHFEILSESGFMISENSHPNKSGSVAGSA